MKCKIFFLIFMLEPLILTHDVFAIITPRGQMSTINLNSGSNFIMQSPLSNFSGMLIRNSGSTISGQTITFARGTFEDLGNSLVLTATLVPATNSLDLLGSNSLVAARGRVYQNIRISGVNNRIEGQPLFNSDINFLSLSSGLTIAIQSNCNGNINLNGGSLRLEDNLSFADSKQILGSGVVALNGNKLRFGSKPLTFTNPIYWDSANDIELNGKTSLSSLWTFSQTSILNGNGNILDLSLGGSLAVENGSVLYLTDVVIKGIGGNLATNNFLMNGINSQIRTSNVTFELDGNITTTAGGIYVEGPTTIVGKGCTWTFSQQGSLTVDSITLWKDLLDARYGSNVAFGSATPNVNFTLTSSGTIKLVANEDILMSDTTYLSGVITSSITYLDVKISNTMADIWSNYLTTSAYLDNRITITVNDVWAHTSATAYDTLNTRITVTMNDIWSSYLVTSADVISLNEKVYGTSYTGTSGSITLNNQTANNFTILDTGVTLSLTIANGSILNCAAQDIILRSADQINVIGRNNIIDVTNTFSVFGNIYFIPGAELIFNFNDQGSDPKIYLNSDITLPVGSRIEFRGDGTLVLKDGTVITFNGTTYADKPRFVLSGNAYMLQGTPIGSNTESKSSFKGKGKIEVTTGGKIKIRDNQSLIFGGTLSTNDLDIFAYNNGKISVKGLNSRISLCNAICGLDVEQGGLISIGNYGVFEVNSLNQVSLPGAFNYLYFYDKGGLYIDKQGKFVIGDNLVSASIVDFDSTGASFDCNGSLQYLQEPSFAGIITADQQFYTNTTNLFGVVENMLQQNLNLTLATQFIDKDGNRKVRLGNGVIVTLLSGDVVVRDDVYSYAVFGVNGGSTFVIDSRGNRSSS